jgi:hypothetical protein
MEHLKCDNCGRTGVAQLSADDRLVWEFRVEKIPVGFGFNGTNFYCVYCNRPAAP